MKKPLVALAAQFEETTGVRIAFFFDTAGAALEGFLQDSGAEILITGKARIRDAEAKGLLEQGIVREIGATVGGFAVAPGKARPDLATPEKLKAALLAAARVAFSDPERGATVGRHFMNVIEKLGIRDQVLEKAAVAQDGVETMRMILSGEADLGVTQIAEIVQASPDALAIPFPEEFDLATTYSLWHARDASSSVVAFVALITGPRGHEKMRQFGLRPLPG
jgi:molybdate transport system substrate-binding protein